MSASHSKHPRQRYIGGWNPNRGRLDNINKLVVRRSSMPELCGVVLSFSNPKVTVALWNSYSYFSGLRSGNKGCPGSVCFTRASTSLAARLRSSKPSVGMQRAGLTRLWLGIHIAISQAIVCGLGLLGVSIEIFAHPFSMRGLCERPVPSPS